MDKKFLLALLVIAIIFVSGCASQPAQISDGRTATPAKVMQDFPAGWQITNTRTDLLGEAGTSTMTWYKRGDETILVTKSTFTNAGDAKKYYDAEYRSALGTKETFGAGEGAFLAHTDTSLFAYSYKSNVKITATYKNTPDETYASKNPDAEKEILKKAVAVLIA